MKGLAIFFALATIIVVALGIIVNPWALLLEILVVAYTLDLARDM